MLLEINSNDIVFIGLAILGLLIFGFVVFSVVMKNKVKPLAEDERYDSEEELFPDIKPVTKEQQEAKDELERVFNQMAADLEKQNETEPIEKFEREQEENAIISYQELIKQAEEKKQKPLKEEIIKKEPIEEKIVAKETKDPVQMEIELEEPKKFKNSEIISPIFGIQGTKSYQKSIEVEKPQPTPKHAYDEMKAVYQQENNADFLKSLKEFREKL